MEKEEVKYKDLIKNEKIKEIIEKINKENFLELTSFIFQDFEEQKKKQNLEGYTSFTFVEPIKKLSGFERYKHQINYILNKNREEEIIQIFLKGKKDHIQHILNAYSWINKKLKENREKESQEKKTIPNELL
jgi:hypothetical protein